MKAQIDALDVARDTVLTVRLKRWNEFKFRVWLGGVFLSLACFVLPFTVKIEDLE